MKLDSAVFYTNDIEAVTGFYQNFLGLKLDYKTPDRFVQFSFENGVKLGIKKAKEEREMPGRQTIFIQAEDVEQLYGRLKEKGAVIYKELKSEPWGTEFDILDPDKNKIVFVRRNA
jgi:predicted enzyme related to lactoylglutathione lyase